MIQLQRVQYKPWESKYKLFKLRFESLADSDLVNFIPDMLSEFDQAEAKICERWDVNTERETVFERELQVSTMRKELALDVWLEDCVYGKKSYITLSAKGHSSKTR